MNNNKILDDGSFYIRKVRLSKVEFGKRQIGINIIDMTEYRQYLRIMTIQIWFKVGIAIFYELHECPQTD